MTDESEDALASLRSSAVEMTETTGSAADSGEGDDGVKSLPRLLRYAVLSYRNGRFLRERLAAEILGVLPSVPLAVAWAEHRGTTQGIALATELDIFAVTLDRSDLRSLSDCVRLLCMPAPGSECFRADHLRVAKALVHCFVTLPAQFDAELGAELETICYGWAALPAITMQLPSAPLESAMASLRFAGDELANRRLWWAETSFRDHEKRAETVRADAASFKRDASQSDGSVGVSLHLSEKASDVLVCEMDAAAMKTPKTKEIAAPFVKAINRRLPLIPVPLLSAVRAQLVFEFPYAAEVVDFALSDLVGRQTVLLKPLLLVGKPGGGKSRFVRRLGETLGVAIWRTDAANSDGSTFGGTDRRWYSAEPSHPFMAVARGLHANPLVLLDELEKAGTRTDYGRIWDSLLGFLEPETAARHADPALQVSTDLSHVSYVATANSVDPLPSPLRDRFRVVAFPEPKAADLDALLPAICADLAAERGLDARWFEPLDGSERKAATACWNGGSVRRLRRVVEAVLRGREKAALRN